MLYEVITPEKTSDTIGSAMFAVGASGLMLSEHVVHKLISTKNEVV